jgi:hypothetical protein
MNLRLARALSFLLHPVWMPAYALVLLFATIPYLRVTVSPAMQGAIFGVVVIDTIVIPLLIIYLLVHRRWVRTFDMEDREERLVPFLTQALCLLAAYYMLQRLQAPLLFGRMMLGAFAAVALAMAVTLRWKISIHLIGVGGLAGLFFGLSQQLIVNLQGPILFILPAAGLIAAARLSLGAHTAAQVYAGFAAGFLCEYLVLTT